MNDLIICLIMVIVGILMTAGGSYLVYDWDRRTSAWEITPSTNEYFDCLAEAWVGAMSAVMGIALLLVSIIAMIGLLI